jgi:hypothetical protein
MDEFGAQIVPFGRAMARFSAIVAGKIDAKAVDAATNAGSALAALEESLPNEGGVVSWFTGDNTLDEFAERIVEFGEGMVAFSDTVSGGVDTAAMTAVVDAAVKVGKLDESLPKKIDLSRISTGLSTLGDAMVEFSEQITGKVNSAAITATTKAAETLTNTAAIMPEEVDLARVTNGLSDFGAAIVEFSGVVSEGVNSEAITSATEMGKKIVEMITGIPAELDLTTYSSGISSLGQSIVDFSSKVTDNVDLEAVENATKAGTKIADMMVGIEPYVELTDFYANVGTVADTICSFSNKVKDNVDLESVENASTAGKKISDMIATIPEYSDIADYISVVPQLANSICTFSNKVKDNISLESVENAVTAGNKISDMVTNVPNYGDIGDYITVVPQLAESIVGFYDTVKDSVNAETIEAATGAGKKIAQMVESIPAYSDVSSFTTNIPSLGTAMADFATNISSIDFETLNSDIGGFQGVMDSFKNIAKSGIDGLISTFANASDDVKATGAKLLVKLIEGAKSKSTDFNRAVESLASKAASAAREKYQNFYNAGKYLVSGFAAGISENDYKAEAKARAMAKAAAQAAEDELDINSPSKVFRKIGMSIPEGFAMGIDKLVGLVTNSSSSMGDTAITGVQNAIARIADVVNTDIDSQPTIRPVLDLSDVRAGAGAIGNLLGFTPSIGLATNVGAISSMMRQRGQNGANEEVVSAINKLRKDVANMPRESYNINGITYDDDSVVTDAIRTLVGAAKRERRT